MKVVAVTSGKGGVGKTSLASSMAVSMQSQGQRVLIIDADLGLADLNIAFGVSPKSTLRDVAEGRISVEQALIETPSGVHLLPAYAGSFDLANLDDRKRMTLLRSLDGLPNRFDVVIVDTGAGIGATAMTFAAAAHDIVVITTRDPTAIADAYATIKVLSRRFAVQEVSLLVNMIDSAIDAGVVYETVDKMARRFLNVRVKMLGYVCRDPHVPSAWRQGQPFTLQHPESPASHCVRVVTSRMLNSTVATERSGPDLFGQRLSLAAGMAS